MSDLESRLAGLSDQHRQALLWFWDRRGQEIDWPEPLADGTFLVNRPKGIHKPKGWRHALSVRQTLGGKYDDRPPVQRPDGTWSYDYFQEGADPNRRDKESTNVGLIACQEDGVPIAVLLQTQVKPRSRYRVWGLANVGGWTDGHFQLEGFANSGELSGAVVPSPATALPPKEPLSLEDARRRIEASIVVRQGSGAFRAKVLDAYQRRCAITGSDAEEALEAAHIVPYLGGHTDTVENAILLRADLHTLFDRQLLEIDPLSLRIKLAAKLRSGSYATLDGRPLSLPKGVAPAKICEMLQARLKVLALVDVN